MYYLIKDIEVLSGIKAHTIRIWEQRYKLLVPKRTDTGIRHYSANDLKKILNIALLNKNKIKISELVKLSVDEIENKVINLPINNSRADVFINKLVFAVKEFDVASVEKILGDCIEDLGLEAAYENVLYPFLIKLGMLWQTNAISPAHEHFICNLIRLKIISAIDSIKQKSSKAPAKVILYLPENEWHELALLYLLYICKKMGHTCLYLGQTTPLADLKDAINDFKPMYIITAITIKQPKLDLNKYLKELVNCAGTSKVLVMGAQAAHVKLKTVRVFNTPSMFKELICQK